MSRILVAEDESRIASFVEKGLRANGFTPTVVGDGATALGHALSGDFDLLVLDIGLPVMDGFTVLRRLRESHGAIPVVPCSRVLATSSSQRSTSRRSGLWNLPNSSAR